MTAQGCCSRELLPVAILAGGLADASATGYRNHPCWALVDVGGRPFAEHQIEWLRSQGVQRIVFCVAFLGERIQQALGDGRQWGVSLEYAFDGVPLLGTGGALRRALPVLGDAFFVLYGDSLLTMRSPSCGGDAFRASNQDGLMTVFRNDDRWDRSNVLFENGHIIRYDKADRTVDMRHIDYGLGVLTSRGLFCRFPDEPFDLPSRLSAAAGDERSGRSRGDGSVLRNRLA